MYVPRRTHRPGNRTDPASEQTATSNSRGAISKFTPNEAQETKPEEVMPFGAEGIGLRAEGNTELSTV